MNNIEDKIALSEEILSAFPKNNNKNIKNYINEANKIYAEYQTMKIDIIEEMKQRVKNFENSIESDQIPKANFTELDYGLKITCPLNTPYEKLNIDEIFYNLDNFSQSNFEEVNEYIFKLIKIFNNAGIKITSDDFFYDEYENSYMQVILSLKKDNKNNQTLKPYFEEFYWKNPNIIRDIELNFKSLYHHNKKIFNSYIKNLQKNINKNYDQIIKEYQSLIVENNLVLNSNKELLVKKFISGELNINDYFQTGIAKLTINFITGNIHKYGPIIYNFNDTLKEYQSYLRIKTIIDKIKEQIKSTENKKNKRNKLASDKKIKEIFNLEKKLKKAFKKKKNEKELVKQIAILYQEYDNHYYEEAILNNINSESKIIDAINFLLSYYSYFLILTKETINNENNEMIIKYAELKRMFLNPNVNLINNLNLIKEYDMETIILDKYKLDNLNLDLLTLDDETLNDLIDKTNKLVNYFNIINIKGLEIEEINKYLKLRNIIKND